MELTPDPIDQPLQPQTHILQVKKPISPILIIIVLIVILTIAVAVINLGQQSKGSALLPPSSQPSITSEEKACTMEAKFCPDGSSVGRVPPNCEFTLCPSVNPSLTLVVSPSITSTSQPQVQIPADWKTYTSLTYKFSIQIPPNWTFSDTSFSNFKPGERYGKIFKTGDTVCRFAPFETNDWQILETIVIQEIPLKIISYKAKTLKPVQFLYDEGGLYVVEQKGRTLGVYCDAEADKETVHQILSTFKFLDSSTEGQFCGGIAGVACPQGYKCQLDGNYPDAGGKCVKK